MTEQEIYEKIVEIIQESRDEELFDYRLSVFDSLYANDEF